MNDDDYFDNYEDDIPPLRPIDEALINAAKNGDVKEIKRLIADGADVAMRDPYHEGWALQFAADNGHVEVVKTLIEHGANVNADEESALKACVRNGDLELVQLLVESGANVHVGYGDVLIDAADSRNLELVKYIVERGVSVSAQFDAPVQVSARAGDLEITRYLIEMGASAEDALSAGGKRIQPAIDAANVTIGKMETYGKLMSEMVEEPKTRASQILDECSTDTPPVKKPTPTRLKL